MVAVRVKLPWWSALIGLEVTTRVIPDDDPPIGTKLTPVDAVKRGRRSVELFYELPE
jgi:hypothetical protein